MYFGLFPLLYFVKNPCVGVLINLIEVITTSALFTLNSNIVSSTTSRLIIK
jgi:hypothetical protein